MANAQTGKNELTEQRGPNEEIKWNSYDDGYNDGYSDGERDGEKRGYKDGFAQGFLLGHEAGLLGTSGKAAEKSNGTNGSSELQVTAHDFCAAITSDVSLPSR